MIRIKNSVVLIFVFFTFYSCDSTTKKSEKPLIVTTTGMIADAVKNVVDTLFTVESLMGPGVDPHLYKTKQSDTKKMMEAEVIFHNGVHLEGKMSEALENLSKSKTVIAVASGFDQSRLISNSAFAGSHDPHIWFDVQLWIKVVQYIKHEMQKKYPQHKDVFEKNAVVYVKKLEVFDEWIRLEIEKIPLEKRVMITAHDAFSYFGRAYNIQVRGLQGISTASEYGLNDRIQLVNFICEQKIAAVFVESSVSPKSIQAIMEDCNQKGHPLKLGGELFSDAMGAANTSEGTYIGMIEHNVKTIVAGLK